MPLIAEGKQLSCCFGCKTRLDQIVQPLATEAIYIRPSHLLQASLINSTVCLREGLLWRGSGPATRVSGLREMLKGLTLRNVLDWGRSHKWCKDLKYVLAEY